MFKKKWDSSERYNFKRLSVFVGEDESKINFGWYSTEKSTPKIYLSKKEDMSDAEEYSGSSYDQIDYTNYNPLLFGEKYYTNRVTVKNLQPNTQYYYQRYIDGVLEDPIPFHTHNDKDFKFVFLGDPQIGGSNHRYSRSNGLNYTSIPDAIRNDVFNWERTINKAIDFADPSLILSAGDQADTMLDWNKKDLIGESFINIESEYSGFLYPEVMQKIVTATCVGNHEATTSSFDRHFNVPNPLKDAGVRSKYGDWAPGNNYFFKYNNVLVTVLETNYNNETDYRRIIRRAVKKYPDADWRIALFHHDIFGNGSTHSQSDAKKIRGVLFNVLSSYNFDLVINGHDHVYTSTKFISYDYKNATDMNDPDNYKVENIKINKTNKNPKGTFFVTANCSTGAKYLDFLKEPNLDYVFNFTQSFRPTFGVLDFTQSNGKVQMKITTYDVETTDVVDGSYIFEKDAGSNVDKVY